MEAIGDLLIKLLPVLFGGGMLLLSFRKAPLENRASHVNTEGNLLDNYNKLVDRLTAQDEKLSKATDVADDQALAIKQLRRGEDQLHKTIEQSNKDVADYKLKWDSAILEIQECRSNCEKQAAEIRVLRAVLSKKGLLTPELELEIAESLKVPPQS